MDDFELIKGCIAGGKRFWDVFVEQFTRLIYDSIIRTFKKYGAEINQDIIDDLHNDIFVFLLDDQYNALKAFEGRNGCTLASYIRTIAIRKTIDYWRRLRPTTSIDHEGDYEEGKRQKFFNELAIFDNHDSLEQEDVLQMVEILFQHLEERREADLPAAYKKLQQDFERIKTYLLSKDIDEKELFISPIGTTKIFKKTKEGKDTNDIESYELVQVIEIRSHEVGKVDSVSRESTELINEGIQLVSATPDYFYTKLDELKIEMLARATENAKLRAESMAKSTGNRVGFIRSAKMGVFQITPVTSTDVSDWGENDTSSLDKKVMAVVSASFAIK
ncbi:MAG: SIMPL domain-containing protein [Candidatus Omnitrophica bacterium]|nr:SIMPL domain-containing protein [Candidatus Omnitrophota bacterium]